MSKNVTMREVAAHAGVSIATVSHVMNKTRHVNQQTRELVLKSIDELGYAFPLPPPDTQTANGLIGLIIADIREDYYTEIVKAAESTAQENGFSIILCDSEDDKEKEHFYLRMLINKNVQGIVLAPIDQTAPPFLLEENDIPVVLIDRRYDKQTYDFIGIDNFAAGRDATLHLMLEGASRIGFIGYNDSVYTIHKRILGYREALKLSGAEHEPHVLRLKYHTDRTSGKIADMVREHHLDGLVCGTSHACYETVTALKECGIPISDDLRIVTFDENKWFEFLSFPLSVVRQPTTEIGTLAVEFVINKLRNPQLLKREPRSVLLNAEIVRRSSDDHSEL
ncbi:MAG: LacI family transcriptional regulator [Spartobacteria bacterium]|nr:LacI family transcriptional regulator [Spartobacteria bacterium]